MCAASNAPQLLKRIVPKRVNREVDDIKLVKIAQRCRDRVGAIPATRVRFAMKQAGNRVGVVPTVSGGLKEDNEQISRNRRIACEGQDD